MKTMDCPDPETLSRILLGCSQEIDIDDFENHLASCEICRSACDSATTTDELTAALQFQTSGAGNDLPDDIACLVPRLQQLNVRFTTQPEEPDGIDVRILLGPAEADDEMGRFGGYRVLKFLGQGGMGLVFSAEDPSLKRLVALKILNPVLAASRIACRRFEREAQAAAAFEHDHIITIYHVGEEAGLPFFAMQLLEGESLQDRLDREKQLSPQMTQQIGRQIASGLAAAHDRGLLHRDIKPDNIWLQADSDRVKILDFGLVQLSESSSRLTDIGAVIGTPAYMAPEQASGSEVDQRCDLFSLGSLMYRCVTGNTPFQRDSAVATLVAVAEQDVQPAKTVCDCPPDLSDAISRLMQKEVDHRPASAAEVVELLKPRDHQAPGEPVAMPKPDFGGPSRIGTLLIATCAAAAAFLLTVVIQIKTDKGTLQVELQDDQFAATVEGQTLTIREVSTGKELKVRPGENSVASGEYEFLVQSLPDGIEFSTPKFSILRGRKKLVEVSFEPLKSETAEGTTDAAEAMNASRNGEDVESSPELPPATIVEPIRTGTTGVVSIDPQFPTDDPDAPIGPGALVSSPAPLPGVAKWTVEPKHDAVEFAGPFLSDDGQWMAAVGRRGSIRVWSINDLSNPRILYGHRSTVTEIQWSPGGTRLATASDGSEPEDSFVLIRQTEDWTPTHKIVGKVSQLSWSHSGNKLAFLTFEDRDDQNFAVLNICDVNSGQVRRQTFPYEYPQGFPRPNPGAGQNRIEWSPDDRSIALSRMKTIRCIDPASLQLQQTLNVEALDFRWAANNKQLTVQTPPRRELSRGDKVMEVITPLRFEVWDIKTGKPTNEVHERIITGNHTVVWNNDGEPMVAKWPQRSSESDGTESTSESGHITLIDVSNARETLIAISDDWKFAASGALKWSRDRKIVACLNVEGLYVRTDADDGNWKWVADIRHWAETRLKRNNKEIWQMRMIRNPGASKERSMFTSTRRISHDDLKMTSAVTPGYLASDRTLSPDGTTLAELVFDPGLDEGQRWSLQLSSQGPGQSKAQTFPMSVKLLNKTKRTRLCWSSDSSGLALLPHGDIRLSGKSLRLFTRGKDHHFEETPVTRRPRFSKEAAFAWSPDSDSFAWATDRGPAIFNVESLDEIEQLPLDAEFRDLKPSTTESYTVRCFHWIDENTLFGGVSGQRAAVNRDNHDVGYLWKRDADGQWQVEFKFVGNAFSDSFLSPDGTRIAYAESEAREVHVADLTSGLMETFRVDIHFKWAHKESTLIGWFTNDRLGLKVGREPYYRMGTLNLNSGINRWTQRFGGLVAAKDGFFFSQIRDVEFYNPDLKRQSTIALSARDRAAKVSVDGTFKVNANEPCELMFVLQNQDGTTTTLTQADFEERFGTELSGSAADE